MLGEPYLDPTVAVLWREHDVLQVGLDPDRAVALRGVTSALPGLLERLGADSSSDVADVARALGTLDELGQVVALLRQAGLVTEGAPGPARARAWIEVVGDGAYAGAVCDGLRAAGVGRVLRSSSPETPSADLVVLAPDTGRGFAAFEVLMSTGTPHLWSHVRDSTAVVGPLVVPGHSSCLRCHDVHRSEADAAWPALALAWEHRARPVTDPATVAAAAALVVRQALAFVAGTPAATLGATLEERPDGQVVREPCPPHPGCGCMWGGPGDRSR